MNSRRGRTGFGLWLGLDGRLAAAWTCGGIEERSPFNGSFFTAGSPAPFTGVVAPDVGVAPPEVVAAVAAAAALSSAALSSASKAANAA